MLSLNSKHVQHVKINLAYNFKVNLITHLEVIALFSSSQFISFREEDLWNFSQSEHIIVPGSHIEYPTGTKNSNFVEVIL
jgi:hypothetical protein